jgi:hypothetical protein
MVRAALSAGDPELAQRLSEGVEAGYALQKTALDAARAQLAEYTGDHAEAAALYASVAERWEGLGAMPEQAYALLGLGRSLLALDDSNTERPLARAAELFRAMGYRPALAEAESLTAGLKL